VGLTKAENEARHNKWLDDIAIRLLCVFALDRFGDFVSDQVKKFRNILNIELY
jgi:TATA-binding protein-associated factor